MVGAAFLPAELFCVFVLLQSFGVAVGGGALVFAGCSAFALSTAVAFSAPLSPSARIRLLLLSWTLIIAQILSVFYLLKPTPNFQWAI